MKLLSLLAHPRPGSFCHALSDAVSSALAGAGHVLVHHDLYADGFDPGLPADEAWTSGSQAELALARSGDPRLQGHRRDIAQAEGLLVVHPDWWGMPPAILVGWLDRVLVPGVAYRLERGDGPPQGLLRLHRALVLNTSDTPPDREREVFGDPLATIWGRCVLPFCGVHALRRSMFGPIAGSDPAQRAGWLAAATATALATFAQPQSQASARCDDTRPPRMGA